MSSCNQVVLPAEAEAFVESLRRFDLKNIGGQLWARQHEFIEKLNIQAVLSASTIGDEFVKEFLLTHEKFPLIVEDLLLTEIWKEKIFPEIKAFNFKPKLTFPMYIILYHEAVVVNLLETSLYHKECAEAMEDVMIDLVDYCYRKLTTFIGSQTENASYEDDSSEKNHEYTTDCMEELCHQIKTLEFDIMVKAASLLYYAIDHLDSLPLSVMTRLLNTYDTPILLLTLIQQPPWTKRTQGKIKKYVDNRWVEVSHGDSLKLTKTEGQVWIGLFQLLMNASCQQKYEMNEYRKNMLLKLRSYINEVLLDQMPILCDLQRYLEHLSIMDPPPFKKDLIIEQLPEMRDKILSLNSGKWRAIAQSQMKAYLSCDDDAIKDQATRWADTYSSGVIEGLVSEPPRCATCGHPATKRCSRCENEWYCRRECQVSHWAKHKKVCSMMQETLKKLGDHTIS